VDIAEKVKQAKETELSIGKAREVYRTVATRGSLVYFLIDTLNALDRCYHYSMANFVYILRKGEQQPRIPDCVLCALLDPSMAVVPAGNALLKHQYNTCLGSGSRNSLVQHQYNANSKKTQRHHIRTMSVNLVSVKYSIRSI